MGESQTVSRLFPTYFGVTGHGSLTDFRREHKCILSQPPASPRKFGR